MAGKGTKTRFGGDGSRFFPRAASYAAPQPLFPAAVREPSPASRLFPLSERHVQCVWYDPELRPPELRTDQGERVVVEDPGLWNLEPGPDFLGAALRIGPDRRRIAGDVEIHVHPSDWKSHSHAADPRYARVRIHVTYFPGRTPPGALPAGAVQIALKDALAANPLFSFESIDPTAYPHARRGTPTLCHIRLKTWHPDRKAALLDAAGEERLRRKAERMAGAVADKGAGQVVYEELLSALGYKHNKAPFRQLAERVPLAALREEAGGDAGVAYALLLGVAGLLPDRTSPRWDRETKSFVRALWDEWWKRKERWESRLVPKHAWRLAGLRPQNHPARRLMAAARLFTQKEDAADQWVRLARRQPAECLDRIRDALEAPGGTYWDRRLALSGPVQRRPVALIGRTRADAVINNVVVPFLASQNLGKPFDAGILGSLPAEADNQVVRQTALSLFGADHSPSLYRSGLRQQGLIQIFHDYCLNDRSRCAACGLPALLQGSQRI